jgi:hypothetical protein
VKAAVYPEMTLKIASRIIRKEEEFLRFPAVR